MYPHFYFPLILCVQNIITLRLSSISIKMKESQKPSIKDASKLTLLILNWRFLSFLIRFFFFFFVIQCLRKLLQATRVLLSFHIRWDGRGITTTESRNENELNSIEHSCTECYLKWTKFLWGMESEMLSELEIFGGC